MVLTDQNFTGQSVKYSIFDWESKYDFNRLYSIRRLNHVTETKIRNFMTDVVDKTVFCGKMYGTNSNYKPRAPPPRFRLI